MRSAALTKAGFVAHRTGKASSGFTNTCQRFAARLGFIAEPTEALAADGFQPSATDRISEPWQTIRQKGVSVILHACLYCGDDSQPNF